MTAHARGEHRPDDVDQLAPPGHDRPGRPHSAATSCAMCSKPAGPARTILDNELQRIHRDMHMIAAHTVFDLDGGAGSRPGAAESRTPSTPSTAASATPCSTPSNRATATVEQCYAPDMTMWFNVTGQTSTREENLATLAAGYGLHRRRTYDDRIVNTFDDGFVAQYTTRWSPTTAEASRCRHASSPRCATGRSPSCSSISTRASSRRGPAMTEYEIRELCEAFFDAYENRRVDVLDRLYSDDCIIWHNVFGRETTRDENLAAPARRLQGPAPAHLQRPERQHVPRRLRDPVLAQRRAAQRASRRAVDLHRRQVRDGKITRIDEYMDSSKFAAWAGRRRRRRGVRKDWQTLELCDRFFDSIEQNDYETLEACYAPEAVIWHSHDCLYQSRADNLAMLKQGMETQPSPVQGPPHPRLRRWVRPATHDLRHARERLRRADGRVLRRLRARRHDQPRLRVLRHRPDRQVPRPVVGTSNARDRRSCRRLPSRRHNG